MARRTPAASGGEQDKVVAFLADPATHGGAPVERIDTHISMVFLAGERAYKLKRAVMFDFLDFSTREARRKACEAELRLNRRTAPDLYLRVVPVSRTADGSLSLGGPGEPVDWLVEMRRFPQDALFSALAARKALSSGLIESLADAIAALHEAAEIVPGFGGASGMARVVDGLDPLPGTGAEAILDGAAARAALAGLRGRLKAGRALLEERRRGGFVRRCHGDLHLGNVCLVEGRPTLFDCIEFSDELACIDTLYDFAFALMDLWERGERTLANRLFNRYEAQRFDGPGLALLPLFLGARSAIRAKTRALLALTRGETEATVARAAAEARAYLAAAQEFLAPPAPCLVALGGLSGSGKTTVARALAPALLPAPGALLLRSDAIRKELLGARIEERLSPEGYRPGVSARVYATIRERAGAALAAGHAVIADAVHAAPAERDAIEAVAAKARAPFAGFWLEAPPAVLEARLAARTRDASDATVEVLRRQLGYALGVMAWTKLDAAKAPGDIAAAALARLGPRGG